MASSAQYVGIPKIDSGIAITADTSRTAPANAAIAVAYTAGLTGSRVDTIQVVGLGTTVQSQLRLWVCKGDVGRTILTMTSSTTTATCTTASIHNLVTGDLVTIQGAFPIEYNVKSVAITVTSTVAFTFTIVTTASVAASTLGSYSTTRATASYSLLREIPILAVTPSASTSAFNVSYTTAYNGDILPIILPGGYSIRASVNDAQPGVQVTCMGGDF